MAVDCIDGYRRGKREKGEKLMVKNRSNPGVENGLADAGRDVRTYHGRPTSKA